MKTVQTPAAQDLIREEIGSYVVLACPTTGEVRVVACTARTQLEGMLHRTFGSGPRHRPSPRGLSGGPG